MFIEEVIGAFTGQNRRTRHQQVYVATLLGLAAGAVAAILLAPQSGEETRQDIAEFAVKSADVVKEKSVETGKKLKETATDLYGKVEGGVNRLIKKDEGLEDVVDDAAKQARAAARDARRKVREAAGMAEDVLTDEIAEAVEAAEGSEA